VYTNGANKFANPLAVNKLVDLDRNVSDFNKMISTLRKRKDQQRPAKSSEDQRRAAKSSEDQRR
jgi:nitrogen fixation/metabolism regulation signal transduction histidine kinase